MNTLRHNRLYYDSSKLDSFQIAYYKYNKTKFSKRQFTSNLCSNNDNGYGMFSYLFTTPPTRDTNAVDILYLNYLYVVDMKYTFVIIIRLFTIFIMVVMSD